MKSGVWRFDLNLAKGEFKPEWTFMRIFINSLMYHPFIQYTDCAGLILFTRTYMSASAQSDQGGGSPGVHWTQGLEGSCPN